MVRLTWLVIELLLCLDCIFTAKKKLHICRISGVMTEELDCAFRKFKKGEVKENGF